jgi:hypothetical protein
MESLEVRQVHGELWEELARRRRVDDKDRQAREGRQGSREDLEHAVAMLREQGEEMPCMGRVAITFARPYQPDKQMAPVRPGGRGTYLAEDVRVNMY